MDRDMIRSDASLFVLLTISHSSYVIMIHRTVDTYFVNDSFFKNDLINSYSIY